MWHSSFARIKKQGLFFIICTHIFEFWDHKQNSNKKPIRTQAQYLRVRWLVRIRLFRSLNTPLRKFKICPYFSERPLSRGGHFVPRDWKSFVFARLASFSLRGYLCKKKKQSSFNLLGQNGLCVTAVYFSLSSFLSLLTRNYPHEETCDVTIDNKG